MSRNTNHTKGLTSSYFVSCGNEEKIKLQENNENGYGVSYRDSDEIKYRWMSEFDGEFIIIKFECHVK